MFETEPLPWHRAEGQRNSSSCERCGRRCWRRRGCSWLYLKLPMQSGFSGRVAPSMVVRPDDTDLTSRHPFPLVVLRLAER